MTAPRLTAQDFDQELLILFDAYVHGAVDRRGFLERAQKYATAGVSYTAHSYAGTQHGFHNDTTPRFDAPAAKLAWERTLAFFGQHLKG